MNYINIMEIVEKLRGKVCTVDEVPVDPSSGWLFPYDCMYRGQPEAIQAIIDNDVSLLCSETGSGKTLVFLAAAHYLGVPTLVLEPRKFLQQQVANYYADAVIYGRSEYECKWASTAKHAPCIVRHKKDGKLFFWAEQEDYVEEISFGQCINSGCSYYNAVNKAKDVLENNGVLIANFGNFRRYLKKAEFVVIDEADELCRMLSSGMQLETQKEVGNIADMLSEEIGALNEEVRAIEEIGERRAPTKKEKKRHLWIENALGRLDFFQENSDVCFSYLKKTGHKVYVELMPNKTGVLLERTFGGHKLCIVSATPGAFLKGKE